MKWIYILFVESKMQMSQFQGSDKILENQYTVHKFYVSILEEMADRLVCNDRRRPNYINWSEKTSLTFIEAVKYYLNHQPDIFA